ncbi:MAG: alpha/beta hydrolase [Nitrospirota bacterium]
MIIEKSFSFSLTKANIKDKSVNGKLYGSDDIAIIFSNMDTNEQNEWNPIISDLISDRYMGLTYDYPEHMDDQSEVLEEVISFARGSGAKKIVLVGASRGGVASIKVAARHVNNDSIIGIVAISAPIEYEGTVFYSNDELRAIKIPKLLLNSEKDGGAEDNRKMIEIFREPKELIFYSGDAHGTELFDNEQESVTIKIKGFIKSILNN